MVVVLLLPVLILLAACLLDRIERRVTGPAAPTAPAGADGPVAPEPAGVPAEHATGQTAGQIAEPAGPLADVVPIRPSLDADTLRLRRAS